MVQVTTKAKSEGAASEPPAPDEPLAASVADESQLDAPSALDDMIEETLPASVKLEPQKPGATAGAASTSDSGVKEETSNAPMSIADLLQKRREGNAVPLSSPSAVKKEQPGNWMASPSPAPSVKWSQARSHNNLEQMMANGAKPQGHDESEPDEAGAAPAMPGLAELSFEDDAIVHKYSLNEKLPSGVVYNNLSRIRGTLNMHAQKVCHQWWYDTFVEKTAQALLTRLTAYESKCVGGMDIDIEAAYKDLVKRGAAMLHLRKMIRVRLGLTCV